MLDFFKSKQQRDVERSAKLKMGKRNILRLVAKQQDLLQRLHELAKRALTLGDERQFKQLGNRYLALQDDIAKKQRYLLSLDALEAQLEQSRQNVEFLDALKGLTGSIMGLADPKNIAAMQRDVEDTLARAESLSDRMDVIMDLAADTLDSTELNSDRLAEMQHTLQHELDQSKRSKDDPTDKEIQRLLAEIQRLK
ncbi:MAG: hypothetical protein KIH69_008440 [Anaerolineae bacterium]|nr:hypothetical protein [Anaerolineae bacterium]